MKSDDLKVEPFSQNLGGATVTAVIRLDRANNSWEVTVVLTRFPDQPPILGEAVEAQLLDDQDVAMEMLERPSGALVEAGGSLGMSANAPFKFRAGSAAPAHLLVTYGGETVRFRLSDS